MDLWISIYLKESCSHYFFQEKCDDDAKKNYTDINLVDLSTDMKCFLLCNN